MRSKTSLTFFLCVIFLHGFTQNAKKHLDINFLTIDGFQMGANMFENKHLIITTFSLSNINQSVLMILDSIEKKYYNTAMVVAVPISDSNSQVSKSQLISLIRDSLHLSFPVMSMGTIKNKQMQNFLVRLANDSSTNHFRMGRTVTDQTWMLDSSGVPYSYLIDNQLLSFSMVEKLLLEAEKRDQSQEKI